MQAAGMDDATDPRSPISFTIISPAVSWARGRGALTRYVADALAIARQLGKPSF
jgi:hypothetical protein